MKLEAIVETLLRDLNDIELQNLTKVLNEHLDGKRNILSFYNKCAEQRFSDGLVCPHCGSKHIRKHGRSNGKQRYRCMGCKKTFNTLAKTVFADSKLNMLQWLKYADCMGKGLTKT